MRRVWIAAIAIVAVIAGTFVSFPIEAAVAAPGVPNIRDKSAPNFRQLDYIGKRVIEGFEFLPGIVVAPYEAGESPDGHVWGGLPRDVFTDDEAQRFVTDVWTALEDIERSKEGGSGRRLLDFFGKIEPLEPFNMRNPSFAEYLRDVRTGEVSNVRVVIAPLPRPVPGSLKQEHESSFSQSEYATDGKGALSMIQLYNDNSRAVFADIDGDAFVPSRAVLLEHELIHSAATLAGKTADRIPNDPIPPDERSTVKVPVLDESASDGYTWAQIRVEEALTQGGPGGLDEFNTKWEALVGPERVRVDSSAPTADPYWKMSVDVALDKLVTASPVDKARLQRIADARMQLAVDPPTEMKFVLENQIEPYRVEYAYTFDPQYDGLENGRVKPKPGVSDRSLTEAQRRDLRNTALWEDTTEKWEVSGSESGSTSSGSSCVQCGVKKLGPLTKEEAERAKKIKRPKPGDSTRVPDVELMRGLSIQQVITFAEVKFQSVLRDGGRFTDLKGLGGSGKNVFTALPETRNKINGVVDRVRELDAVGGAFDVLDVFGIITALPLVFGKDLSALDKTAIFAGQIPLLAEVLGIASASMSGDTVDIVRNVFQLLASGAGIAAAFVDPVVAIVIAFVSLLIGAFIEAFKDTSPIQYANMKSIRDQRFQEWLPGKVSEIAGALAPQVGLLFEAWQNAQLFELGLLEAAIDRTAVAGVRANPSRQQEILAEATKQKQAARIDLQIKLPRDRASFIDQGKNAFVSALSATITDKEVVKNITDEVFPLNSSTVKIFAYGTTIQDSRAGSGSEWNTVLPQPESGPWPWAAADGSVTGGWELFAADAAAVTGGGVPGHRGEQPSCRSGGSDAKYFASKSVKWLNDYCYDTLNRMGERYIDAVTRLRTDPFPAPDKGALEKAFTDRLNAADVQKTLTVRTLPAPTDLALPIVPTVTSPANGETNVVPWQLPRVTGTAAPGHVVQIDISNAAGIPAGSVTAVTDVNGFWATGPVLLPRGDSSGGDILRPQKHTLTVTDGFYRSVQTTTTFTTREGRPQINTPSPGQQSVAPGTVNVSGTAIPGHTLTVVALGEHVSAPTPSLTVGSEGTWSTTINVGQALGQSAQVTVTDTTTTLAGTVTFRIQDHRATLAPGTNTKTVTVPRSGSGHVVISGTGTPGRQIRAFAQDQAADSRGMSDARLAAIPDASKVVTVDSTGVWQASVNVGWASDNMAVIAAEVNGPVYGYILVTLTGTPAPATPVITSPVVGATGAPLPFAISGKAAPGQNLRIEWKDESSYPDRDYFYVTARSDGSFSYTSPTTYTNGPSNLNGKITATVTDANDSSRKTSITFTLRQ